MAVMSGEEKASLLLLNLDPQVAEAALARLSPDTKARLRGHMDRLGKSPERNNLIAAVLGEAEKLLEQPRPKPAEPPPATSTDTPRLAAFVPEESAEPTPDTGRGSDAVANLERIATDRLVAALDGESPRAVGV